MKRILVIWTAPIASARATDGGAFDDLAKLYFSLVDGGYAVTFATPRPGQTLSSRSSHRDSGETMWTSRFERDFDARRAREGTRVVWRQRAEDFAALLFAGAGSALACVATNARVARLTCRFYAAGKPVGAVAEGVVELMRAADKLRASAGPMGVVAGWRGEEADGAASGGAAVSLREDNVPFPLNPRALVFAETDGVEMAMPRSAAEGGGLGRSAALESAAEAATRLDALLGGG